MDTVIEEDVKRERRKLLYKLMFIGLLFIGLFGYGIYWLFYDLDRIARNELIAEKQSPNGTYTMKLYRSDVGATTAYSVVSELIFNQEKKKPKTIYFQYKERRTSIEWEDEQTVVINGKALRVPNEVYDYRRE